MSHANCQNLFEAGRVLVVSSGLAHYFGGNFVANHDMGRFEDHWKKNFHEEFGRYMAWVLFSVGAENLAKAACVCNKLVKASDKLTLEDYTKEYFRILCAKPGLCDRENRHMLIDGYRRLTRVRNRDAHAYRENVRDKDFPKVEQLFVPALNTLVEALRYGCHDQI